MRRTLAAAQALTIAGLGTVLGIAAGFVPAVALIGADESLDLVVPWGRLLTRSQVPLERRVT